MVVAKKRKKLRRKEGKRKRNQNKSGIYLKLSLLYFVNVYTVADIFPIVTLSPSYISWQPLSSVHLSELEKPYLNSFCFGLRPKKINEFHTIYGLNISPRFATLLTSRLRDYVALMPVRMLQFLKNFLNFPQFSPSKDALRPVCGTFWGTFWGILTGISHAEA